MKTSFAYIVIITPIVTFIIADLYDQWRHDSIWLVVSHGGRTSTLVITVGLYLDYSVSV